MCHKNRSSEPNEFFREIGQRGAVVDVEMCDQDQIYIAWLVVYVVEHRQSIQTLFACKVEYTQTDCRLDAWKSGCV